MPFTPEALQVLRAVLDRLVPRDAAPGACDAGADEYVQKHCEAHASDRELIAIGLEHLDRVAEQRHQHGFTTLSALDQDGLLGELEEQKAPDAPPDFFERILNLTMEGFYADPENGGNYGGVSWTMVGYDPRRPRERERA